MPSPTPEGRGAAEACAGAAGGLPAASSDRDARWAYLRFVPTAEQLQRARQAGKKVIVLRFQASYCKPCAKESPELSRVADRYRDRDVEILAIHLKKRGRDPKQFALAELAARAMRLSGAELEQVVASGLYKAFADRRELAENDLANAIEETVPLYETYEERIKELRDWARTRARLASHDARMLDYFA